MPDFTNKNIYDSPQMLLEMALDGELTARGSRLAFQNPSGLSEAERTGIVDRLKNKMGRNAISDGLADIALNPWVWAYFVTSPAGLASLKHTGKGMFDLARKWSGATNTTGGTLKHSGALTLLQSLGDNPMTEHGFQVARGVTERVTEGLHTVGNAEAKWLRLNNLNPADGLILNKIPKERQGWVADAMRVMYMKMTGRDRDQVVKFIRGGEIVEDTLPAWTTPAKLDKLVQQYGVQDMVEQSQGFLKQRFQQLYGRDGVADFVPDSDKIVKIWRGLNDKNVWGESASEGASFIRQILGEDVEELAKTMGAADFQKLVEQSFTSTINGNYLPRNMYTTFDPLGRVSKAARKEAWAVRATTNSIARMRGDALHGPEDMAAIERLVGGGSPGLAHAREQANAIVRDAVDEGRSVRFLAMSPVEQVRKYNNESALTWSWFVQKPDERSALAWKKWVANGGGKSWHEEKFPSNFGKDMATYEELADLNKISRDKQPVGGLSLADLAGAAWATSKQGYDRTAITNLLIPAISGRHGVDHLMTASLIETGKRGIRSFLNTDVAKYMKAGGGKAAEWADDLERYSLEGADTVDQARDSLRNAATFLYGTHLSGNIPSALLNATQPFHLAATWVGLGNTAKGYAQGVGEWLNYASERASKYGIGPISEDVRRSLMKKHFKHFDFIQASAPVLEQLDAEAFAADRQPKGPWANFMHYGMSLFRNTEVMNRLATGHAVEQAYKSVGRAAKGATFERDVQRLVLETQFANHPLNTPIAFMTADPKLSPFGRYLANPLARQFLSFPLRSFTSLAYMAPRMGGRENALGAIANDFMRSMATSAVMVVGARSMLGADLERSGYLAGVTDILPGFSGGRFDQRESAIPVPPVIDIPVNIVKGILGDDTQLLGRSISRLIPGGVAISRALGVAPATPLEWLGIQRTHVDWTLRDAQGKVPVYDDRGQILEMRDPAELILQSVGADLGRYKKEGQLTGHLVNNREEILRYRKMFLDAKTAGSHMKAQAVASEFEKRFKIPLTVTQQQIKRYMENRQSTRPERIFATLPNEVKPVYASLLARQQAMQAGGQPPLPQRAPVFPQSEGSSETRAFQPFGGFGGG